MNQDQKIDKILELQHQQNVAMAEFITTQKSHSEKLKEHAVDIKDLNAYKNNAAGKQSVLSMVFGAIGAGIVGLIKFLGS